MGTRAHLDSTRHTGYDGVGEPTQGVNTQVVVDRKGGDVLLCVFTLSAFSCLLLSSSGPPRHKSSLMRRGGYEYGLVLCGDSGRNHASRPLALKGQLRGSS